MAYAPHLACEGDPGLAALVPIFGGMSGELLLSKVRGLIAGVLSGLGHGGCAAGENGVEVMLCGFLGVVAIVGLALTVGGVVGLLESYRSTSFGLGEVGFGLGTTHCMEGGGVGLVGKFRGRR